MPVTLRGEHGEQAQATDAFVEALRERVTVPVETFDERFTSVLAGGDDAKAAAHLLSSYLEWSSGAAHVEARSLLVLAACRARGRAAAACGARRGRPPPPPPPPPPPKPLRIIFPEGFTRRDMAERITAVDAIALHKRDVRAEAVGARVPAADRREGARSGLRARKPLRGLPLPGDVRLLQATRRRSSSSATSSRRSARTGRR